MIYLIDHKHLYLATSFNLDDDIEIGIAKIELGFTNSTQEPSLLTLDDTHYHTKSSFIASVKTIRASDSHTWNYTPDKYITDLLNLGYHPWTIFDAVEFYYGTDSAWQWFQAFYIRIN